MDPEYLKNCRIGIVCATLVASVLITWGCVGVHDSTVKDKQVKIARIDACKRADNIDACLAAVR